MRLLRFYPKLPPCTGGMEQHIRLLSIEQRKMGFEVCIFFNAGQKVSDEDVQILPLIPLHKIKPKAVGIFLFYLGVIIHLIFHKKKAHSIHIHGDWSSFIFGKTIKRLCRANKLFFSIHGAVDAYKNVRKNLLLSSVKKADAVFCTGNNAYEFIRDHSHSHFQPSGLQEHFFRDRNPSKHERFTVITVANFVPVKNHWSLLKVAESLKEIDFIWIGEGPMKEKMKAYSLKKDLSNVLFKGFLASETIAEELQRAHVFLMASTREGTPTSLLEAMASGLPVVTSHAGGISNIIEDGKNGYLIRDPMDFEAYITPLKLLMEKEKLRKEMGQANEKKAREYRWGKVAMNITKIMQES